MQEQRSIESKKITIYDIAKEAGVSPATVSRVLTNNVNVRWEKRARVQSIIDKYNFKPNVLARGLSDTKTRIIGILTADVRNPYYAEMFVSCEQAAHDADYTVLLLNSHGEIEQEKNGLEKLQEQRVDAIIQMGGRVDDLVSNIEYVEKVNQIMATLPIVVTGKLDGTKCHMVRIDSMKAMDLLMDHLLSLGHRKIALIGGLMDVLSTYEKFMRYKQILKEHMIDFIPELVADKGSYNAESGYELMNRMFDKGIIPTAVIAINDFAAAGVLRSIEEHNLKVPADISLVAYDNTYMTELMIPRITSIDYNYKEYGNKLIATAIAEIEGHDCEMLQTVMPSLVVRESSGPVRAKS